MEKSLLGAGGLLHFVALCNGVDFGVVHRAHTVHLTQHLGSFPSFTADSLE